MDSDSGRYAYEGLDRLLHERGRVGILIALSSHPDGVDFWDLCDLCSCHFGVISHHLRLLSDAGLVEVIKAMKENGRPSTLARLTAAGRESLSRYIGILRQVLSDA